MSLDSDQKACNFNYSTIINLYNATTIIFAAY